MDDRSRLEAIGSVTAIQIYGLVKYKELITNLGCELSGVLTPVEAPVSLSLRCSWRRTIAIHKPRMQTIIDDLFKAAK